MVPPVQPEPRDDRDDLESWKPYVRFPWAGAYECDAPDCGCPYGFFSYEDGQYDDGSPVLVLTLACQWGHTTTLRLNNHDGAILFNVSRHKEEGWDG